MLHEQGNQRDCLGVVPMMFDLPTPCGCRAIAEALLNTLEQLRAGSAFYPGVIPVQPAISSSSNSGSPLPSQTACRTTSSMTKPVGLGPVGSINMLASVAGAGSVPATSRSNNTAAASAALSMGSDAVVTSWHAGGPVDVASLTRLVLLVLKVLQRMERWHSAMSIGECSVQHAGIA